MVFLKGQDLRFGEYYDAIHFQKVDMILYHKGVCLEEIMFLTKQGGLIVKPISILLGKVLSWLYDLLGNANIASIGVAIILFTVLIRLCFVPIMFKQNKSSKVMNYIQPELNKITKKYKGKKDQESMMAQQRETSELQQKYGISMASGCLTSLIQLPVFIAFYTVIRNIPAYVDKIKAIYTPITDKIFGNENAFNILQAFQNDSNLSALKTVTLDAGDANTLIDVIAKVPSDQLPDLAAKFTEGGFADIAGAINGSAETISNVYGFFGGIDLTAAPGWNLSFALLIPIFSMVFQFLSLHATPQQAASDPTQQATMKTMKTMMNILPISSLLICISVPAGVGLYWATGALLSFLTSVGINLYFKHCDMEKVVEKCKEKAAKKIAKRKAKGKKTFMERMQEAAMGQETASSNPRVNTNVASTSLKSYTSSTMKADNGNVKYRPGSLAAKANAMQRYSDNNGGKE